MPRRITEEKALEMTRKVLAESDVENAEESNDDCKSDSDYEKEASSSSSEDTSISHTQYDTGQDNFLGADCTRWEEEPIIIGQRQAVNVMRTAKGLSAFGHRKCGQTAISTGEH